MYFSLWVFGLVCDFLCKPFVFFFFFSARLTRGGFQQEENSGKETWGNLNFVTWRVLIVFHMLM